MDYVDDFVQCSDTDGSAVMDQGTGTGSISFDLPRWHGGWKYPLGRSNPARGSFGGAFRSSRRTACESRCGCIVSAWGRYTVRLYSFDLPAGSCCRPYSPRVNSGWPCTCGDQLQVAAVIRNTKYRRSPHSGTNAVIETQRHED